VCFWEDDPVQNDDPQYSGGANSVSLEEARRNYVERGASEGQFLEKVRPPTPEESPIPRVLVGLEKEQQAEVHRQTKIQILAIIRGMLSGRIAVIDGCDFIATLALQLDSSWDGKLRLFEGVASETDEYPRGLVRQEWAQDALALKDLELTLYVDRIRDQVLSACNELEISLAADLKN
jgi:hypothetical protein